MTRINLIDPKDITDLHLIAEIKEINQLCGQFANSLKKGIKAIPTKYCLGTGHVSFFYDKGRYLHRRFNQLKKEALDRGMNIEAKFNRDVWPKKYYKLWHPTTRDYYIVIKRITKRISEKPHLYFLRKKKVMENQYKNKLLSIYCPRNIKVISVEENKENVKIVGRFKKKSISYSSTWKPKKNKSYRLVGHRIGKKVNTSVGFNPDGTAVLMYTRR